MTHDLTASILARLESEGVITTREALERRFSHTEQCLGGELTRDEIAQIYAMDRGNWEDLVEWLKSQTSGEGAS